jgi:hypothetical protein
LATPHRGLAGAYPRLKFFAAAVPNAAEHERSLKTRPTDVSAKG